MNNFKKLLKNKKDFKILILFIRIINLKQKFTFEVIIKLTKDENY